MATVVLTHTHSKVPDHLAYCLRNLTRWNYHLGVHILTDTNTLPEDIKRIESLTKVVEPPYKWHNIQDEKFITTMVENFPFFKNDHLPLWRASAFRLFYIYELMLRNPNMTDVFHFDTDVITYCHLDLLASTCRMDLYDYDWRNSKPVKVLITKHSPTEAVCGMMYIPDRHAMLLLIDELRKYLVKPQTLLADELGSMPHEMRILGDISQKHPDILGTLPVLPTDPNYGLFGCVFDPSSYGQYLLGTHAKNGTDKMTICDERAKRTIDKEIVRGEIVPYFDPGTKRPMIRQVSTGLTTYIANLHVHSKNLKQLL